MKPRLWLALMLVIGGCREEPKGDYVNLTGKLFIFNYRIAEATYVVTLGKLRSLPEGAMVYTEFDNPAGGAPIKVEQKVWPKLEKIAIESPPLTCVVKDRTYAIKIALKDASGVLLQEISTTLRSTLDQTVLPDRPLVVGPVYTANPELKGHPDGKLPDLVKANCPD
jgi:hypothetical protein